MRLTELEPHWLILGGVGRTRGGFTFRCPHCREKWLLVKLIPARVDEQELIASRVGISSTDLLPAPADAVWNIEGDFPDLNVDPFIAAEGHWHGKIIDGELVE